MFHEKELGTGPHDFKPLPRNASIDLTEDLRVKQTKKDPDVADRVVEVLGEDA
ncbi:hypothetical protein [Novosphingobium sp. MBES04]|uniref:hypothetical protein n=1 Tax=Novosphingobium sp. MBES04 TaxID=1206458 RepID=UPI000A542E98|nr:hypothetical protein [Novosphingobium sp. MBES04]